MSSCTLRAARDWTPSWMVKALSLMMSLAWRVASLAWGSLGMLLIAGTCWTASVCQIRNMLVLLTVIGTICHLWMTLYLFAKES